MNEIVIEQTETSALTTEEAGQLQRLESIVTQGLETFIEVGNADLHIWTAEDEAAAKANAPDDDDEEDEELHLDAFLEGILDQVREIGEFIRRVHGSDSRLAEALLPENIAIYREMYGDDWLTEEALQVARELLAEYGPAEDEDGGEEPNDQDADEPDPEDEGV